MQSTHRVYLIHFERPFGHAEHYLGFARDLKRRIRRHRSGNGSRLLHHVQNAGIRWYVVRTWVATREREQLFKRHQHNRRLCPVCIDNADLLQCAKRWPRCNAPVIAPQSDSQAA